MAFLPSVASQHPQRVVIGAGCAITAVTIVACLSATSSPARPAAAVAPPVEAPMASSIAPVAPAPAPPEVHSSELMFVFQAGDATYMRLADLRSPGDPDGEGPPIPRHGKLRLGKDDVDPVDTVIATVRPRDVPAAYARWRGRKVKVDRACEASVVGFAVVARVVGDPSYAGLDTEAWDAASVMKAGHVVLAAKLDGCTGTFARDAALPDVVVPTQLDDAALEQAAIAALIASPPAHDTQREWDQQKAETGAPLGPWYADDAVTAEVLRHPRTGVTFVAVHGHVGGGCGDPHANVWGLFRVTDGALAPVEVRQLGEMETIEAVLDVDGDGSFELLGRPSIGFDVMLTHANGDLIDQLVLPFHGCPC